MAKEMQDKKGIPFLWWPMIVMLVTFALDQISKIVIDMCCQVGWIRCVIPGCFNLVHWRNTGCAWGFFNEHTWALALLSVIVFAAVLYFFKSLNEGRPVLAFAIAMLEGGIAGNMVDRVFRASVIDFLDFYFADAHWPAFNIADSAICVSIALLILMNFISPKKKNTSEKG